MNTPLTSFLVSGVAALALADAARAGFLIDFESFDLGGETFLDVPETLLFLDVGGSGIDVTINGMVNNRIYDLFLFGGDPNAVGQALIDWGWNGPNPDGTDFLFSAGITSFSIEAGDFGGDDDSPLQIVAFDADDQMVAMDSVPWSSFPPFATLSVNAPDIRRVRFSSGGTFPGSVFMDNMMFTPVPVPGTLGLLVFGALAMPRRRRSS